MKYTNIRLLALASCFLITPIQVMAQAERALIDDCFEALSSGDQQAIEEASTSVMDIGRVSSLKDRMDAGICLTKATGRRWQYYPKLNKLIPSSIVATISDMSDLPRQAEEAYQAKNSSLIAQDVFAACQELYSREPTDAMTNKSCIETFSANGHPKMLPQEEFVRQFISKKFSNLSEEEIFFVLDMFPASVPD